MSSIIEYLSRNRRIVEAILAALLIVLGSINVFSGLGKERIRSWDEARHGVSSCEMMESGNYIVNTYNHSVDYWNVKPVLSFYNNIIGMKLFGRNIFGFRFFSALSYLIIAALIYLLLRKEAGIAAAFVGSAAFLTLPTNWVHSFRTGDPDATFMMFCFAAFVCLWYSARKGWLLSLCTFFLGLAFLVKTFHVGIHGILVLIFVGFHWKRYSWRDLLLALVSGAAPVLIWAGARFHADGWKFFQSMINLDLLGRVGDAHMVEHSDVVWYEYFQALNHYLVVIPLAIAACAIALGLIFKGKKCFSSSQDSLGRWTVFFFLFSFSAFSACHVKLKWYIFPSLVYFTVTFGMLFHFACRWIREESEKKPHLIRFLPPLTIIIACMVWLGIGEGKAIHNVVKLDVQHDVLTDDGHGGDAYRGCVFYSVNQDGVADVPHQKFMLVVRFLDGKLVLKNVEEYKNATDDAFLVCRFEEAKTERMGPMAEGFAARHSLKLIRYANGQALYHR